MAGVKGRSGGARPNSGPRPKEPVKLAIPEPITESLAHKDPKIFLLALMNDIEADVKLRADAAKALLPFMHQKLGEGGKKDEKANAAKKASTGKFGAAPPPLKLVNGA